ncbi:MAG: hypothetical protein AB9866_27035 [Syntrophobacteraceae bacterium]
MSERFSVSSRPPEKMAALVYLLKGTMMEKGSKPCFSQAGLHRSIGPSKSLGDLISEISEVAGQLESQVKSIRSGFASISSDGESKKEDISNS